MNRQWFWYPHPDLEGYLSDLDPSLLELRIKLDNSSTAIDIQTDDPFLLDLLSTKYYRDSASQLPIIEPIPRLTYLHNTAPIKHSRILTPDNILQGSRERTDIAFVPLTNRVLFHRPALESIVRDKKAQNNSLREFLLAYSSGLVKSLVTGLASFVEPNAVGCHAAVLELNGKGVALVGATGSGKSTYALRFLLAQDSAILITDDWCLVRPRQLDFISTALERHFFARKSQIDKLIEHYPNALQADVRRINQIDADSRVDLDLSSIFGNDRFVDHTKLDVLVCITRTPSGQTGARRMEESEFITRVITDSPHIPFHSISPKHYEVVMSLTGHELYSIMLKSVEDEIQFWRTVYQRLPVFSVYYSDSTSESTVQALIMQIVEAL